MDPKLRADRIARHRQALASMSVPELKRLHQQKKSNLDDLLTRGRMQLDEIHVINELLRQRTES